MTPPHPDVPAARRLDPKVLREVVGLVMALLGVAGVLTTLALICPLAAAATGSLALAVGGLYLASSEV